MALAFKQDMFIRAAGGFEAHFAGGEIERHGSAREAADLFGVDFEAVVAEQGAESLIISLADVEVAAFVHELSTAGDADLNPMFFGAELVCGPKQCGDAGIDESGGVRSGVGGIDLRVREHGMEQAARSGNRVVNRDAEAGSEGVGGEGDRRVVGDSEVADADDDLGGEFRKSSERGQAWGGHMERSEALVDAWPQATQWEVEAVKAFGMADDQKAVRDQGLAKTLCQILLCCTIEVDHDISAKDQLEPARVMERAGKIDL